MDYNGKPSLLLAFLTWSPIVSKSQYPNSQIDQGQPGEQTDSNTTGREVYNVVSDTVTGVNVRLTDNVFQALFIFASIVVVALVGVILTVMNPRWGIPREFGGLFGAFAGLVLGTLASGTILMIYRGLRHLKGEHK